MKRLHVILRLILDLDLPLLNVDFTDLISSNSGSKLGAGILGRN